MAYFRVKFYVSLSSIKVRNHGVQYSVLFSNSDYRVHEYRLHLTQQITKQLFLGDIHFYVANIKCSYEPFTNFHGEVKGTLLTSPIFVHGT